MPSSTSSSDGGKPDLPPERPLPERPLGRSAVIALLIAATLLGTWEAYWRSYGVEPAYRNSEGLWAMERRRINRGDGDRTVVIGSSRNLFNIQLDAWEQESGERPIQLSLEGTSPVGVLEGLADDPDFTGTLLVGVAPGLFFSGFEYRRKALDRYDNETPSQWLGQRISMLFEPFLAFYSFDFALFTVIERQPWPERDGVPGRLEVRLLETMGRDRNTRMWSKVENDPEYNAIAKAAWADGFIPIEERDEEWLKGALENRDKQIDRAATAVRKLMDRGVQVIFIRNPSEGHYALSEPMYFPREETWDVLLEKSGAPGLHWEDHEEMQGYTLPEWSHLSGSEADRYTKSLYRLVQRELERHYADSAREDMQ